MEFVTDGDRRDYVKDVYARLNEHRDWFVYDNDYKAKFQLVERAATDWNGISYESKPHAVDVASFMMEVLRRMEQ